MTLTGDAGELYVLTVLAASAVLEDLQQSLPKLKDLHAFRLKDERHTKAFDRSKRAFERAQMIHGKLHELARQLRTLKGQATLTEVECALFSYVKDDSFSDTPTLDFA